MVKRTLLKRCAEQIASEMERQSYEHWAEQSLPISFEYTFEDQTLQVEIDVLELEPNYIHLVVSVDDGGLSALLPACTSIIINKE